MSGTRIITAKQHQHLIDIAYEALCNASKKLPRGLAIAVNQCDEAFAVWVIEQYQALIEEASSYSRMLGTPDTSRDNS